MASVESWWILFTFHNSSIHALYASGSDETAQAHALASSLTVNNHCHLRPSTTKGFYTQTHCATQVWFRSPAVTSVLQSSSAPKILLPYLLDNPRLQGIQCQFERKNDAIRRKQVGFHTGEPQPLVAIYFPTSNRLLDAYRESPLPTPPKLVAAVS
jgi:hypothetical protein